MDIDTVNLLAPEHGRTSCTDLESNGNEYFNEFGYPRCTRCALLYYVVHGEWPHGVQVNFTQIKFKGHPRITRF